jgi:LemA protein
MSPLLLAGMIAVIFIALLFNLLVRKRNEVAFGLACIDVQSKKRYDLIPNLIAVCRQYIGYEEQVLKDLTRTRAEAGTPNSAARADADTELPGRIRAVFAVAEKYPELRAVDTFTHLQRSLNEVEEQLSAARRAYNAAVMQYNSVCQAFPTNLIARLLGFKLCGMFEVNAAERESVQAWRQS